jgi:hypothetical protein
MRFLDHVFGVVSVLRVSSGASTLRTSTDASAVRNSAGVSALRNSNRVSTLRTRGAVSATRGEGPNAAVYGRNALLAYRAGFANFMVWTSGQSYCANGVPVACICARMF